MLQTILAGFCYAIQNVSNKIFAEKFRKGFYSLMVLNALGMALGAAVLAILSAPHIMGTTEMLFAFGTGALLILTLSMIVLTVSMGSVGLSSLIIDMNVVIVVLFGMLVWHEPIKWTQGIAMALILGVILLLAQPERDAKLHFKWLMTALLTLLCNGALNIMQTAAFKTCPDMNVMDFSFWLILMGAVISVIAAVVLRCRGCRFPPKEPMKLLLPLSAAMGISTATAFYFHNTGLTLLPSLVVFPVVTGTNNTLLMLSSVLFFHDKMTVRNWLAFVAGLAGILLMNV